MKITSEIDFNAFALRIHQIAVDHGFWKDESHAVKIALMHSELSGALEDWRNNMGAHLIIPELDERYICVRRKPIGWAVELIDCCIRILDFWGHILEIKGDGFLIEENLTKQVYADIEDAKGSNFDFIDLIVECHELIASAYYSVINEIESPAMLTMCIGEIIAYLESQDIDWQKIMEEKIEYNRKRPFMHGNKRC